jgi:thiol-disulfide isomerase/thioredoxin
MPIEGDLPDLDGATAWLNSEPLTPAGLRGQVVLVEFCTYSCVNWLRTLPYVQAWSDRYRDHGLVVIGAHSPEFGFEHDVEKVQTALRSMGVDFPIAVDSDFAVWRAFDNAYWPALYFADAEGRIRHHHFGEEDYERSERVIQQLIADAGRDGFGEGLVSVEPDGVELAADWKPSSLLRPMWVMPGLPASRLQEDWCATEVTSTRSLRSSISTNGPLRETGRWRGSPRR